MLLKCHLTLQNFNQQKDFGHLQMNLSRSRSFKDLDEVEQVLFNRCKKLLIQKDLVRGLTNFYWWPQVTVAA